MRRGAKLAQARPKLQPRVLSMWFRAAQRITVTALGLACLATCSGRAPTASNTRTPPAPPPPEASGGSAVQVVQVPASMQASPFNVTRSLTVPAKDIVAVYARVRGARFLVVTPDGSLLVALPDAGTLMLVRPNPNGDPIISTFASGFKQPQGMAFHTSGGTTYLYVAESDQINRFVYHAGDLTAQGRQVLITGLPDASTPELKGAYGHALKDIALDGNDKLYVSIGSSCNVCTSDQQATPVRGAIYQYDADGSNGRLFAQGIRNAEGLAILPGTNTLWIAVNNRDNIPYPYNDSTGQYGKVIQSYVDNHPPDEFIQVRDGGNYGWPYCNPTPDSPSGYDNMPFDRSFDMNADGHVDCSAMDMVTKGFQAHSAPLGLAFLQNTAAPAAYGQGAVIAFHGSWNRSTKTGYKVVYVPFSGPAPVAGLPVDLVTGWSDGVCDWGRPVGVAVDGTGNLFISDDLSGTIYKLSPPAPK